MHIPPIGTDMLSIQPDDTQKKATSYTVQVASLQCIAFGRPELRDSAKYMHKQSLLDVLWLGCGSVSRNQHCKPLPSLCKAGPITVGPALCSPLVSVRILDRHSNRSSQNLASGAQVFGNKRLPASPGWRNRTLFESRLQNWKLVQAVHTQGGTKHTCSFCFYFVQKSSKTS